MIAPGGKSLPEAIRAYRRSADREDGRLVRCDRRREDALEAVIVNPRKITPEDRRGELIRLQDRGTKLRTGPAKKMEVRAAVAPRIKPVDFAGDPDHGQSVGIIKRYGIPEDGQMPRTQRLGVPLHPLNG
jgi:hypothetical protein